MPVIFAGEPCVDPLCLYRECVARGISTAWQGRANAFTCPLGAEAGEGWVLLTRGALRRIDPTSKFAGLYDLVFLNDASGEGIPSLPEVRLKNLVLMGADCITPAARDQDESVYLVRLADRRVLCNRVVIDKAYNLRHVATRAYLPATLRNPETGVYLPWTWETLLQDLWTRASKLGHPFPGLPSTPNGTPENIECWQMPALDALQMVLTRLRMALCYDPIAETFSIVGTGAVNAAYDAAIEQWQTWRHWDSYPLRGVRGQFPHRARVLFRKLPHVRGQEADPSPFHTIEVTNANVSADDVEYGTVAVVHDDLHALYNASGALTNSSELQSRAEARASELFASLDWITDRLRIVYPFALADEGFRPNSQVRTTRWADIGGGADPDRGMVTEITRAGSVGHTEYPSVTHDPLTQIVKVTGETGPIPELRGAVTQRWEASSQTWVDHEPIWHLTQSADIQGRQVARIVGHLEDRPVYHLAGLQLEHYWTALPEASPYYHTISIPQTIVVYSGSAVGADTYRETGLVVSHSEAGSVASLFLLQATGAQGGAVTTGPQTFAGLKTFANQLVSDTVYLGNGGEIAKWGTTVQFRSYGPWGGLVRLTDTGRIYLAAYASSSDTYGEPSIYLWSNTTNTWVEAQSVTVNGLTFLRGLFIGGSGETGLTGTFP